MINTDVYIDKILAEDEIQNQYKYLTQSLRINWKTMYYGRKWLLYIIIGILPLVFSIFVEDKLYGEPTAKRAFISTLVSEDGPTFYMTLFTFGCLLIAQPLSTDEISDHMIDLYLVRPIRREVIWTSRWIVVNTGVWLANAFIVSIYYLFFFIVDPNGSIGDMFQLTNIAALIDAYILIFIATLCYSGIFLFVGFIGKRGFSLGVMLAIIESFFLNTLFLSDSKYLPRTHLQKIGEVFYKPIYRYYDQPDGMSLGKSYLYVFIVMSISYALGIWYLRRRQFN